jgi:SAM-dependent methyltransferase/nicotinamide mononucleotide adenylyltransferase
MIALLLGRFHAVTRAQHDWIASLATREDLERLVCVITSADHADTRRNPLPVAVRERLVGPSLEASGKPFVTVAVNDIANTEAWVDHVVRSVSQSAKVALAPSNTVVLTANREVDALFSRAGFSVASHEVSGVTPHELVQAVVEGRPWKHHASTATQEVYTRGDLIPRLRAIYGRTLVNDDGELAHARDFASYGAQMDAALAQKLEDLLPWVLPGLIVDKGCGTGRLMVELARRFPTSSFVGVDLSREFLRQCDEHHYASEDVSLVAGDIIEAHVPAGTASTVIFSSVMHEIYSYSDYQLKAVHRALENAALELRPGGHVLIRDGISPGDSPWRLRLISEQTRAQFQKFAREFKHGTGAPHELLSEDTVRLSAHLVNEFLCKKDYLKNWHIEVHEEYGALTLEGWARALERAGFGAIERRGYVNDWIAQNRYAGTVEVFDDRGTPLPWPATNAVIVGQRV